MIWIYRLFFLPALFIALPYYGWRMWRRGGYGKDFRHRFGLIPRLPPAARGIRRIWLQAVSVGEVRAVGPLIELLQRHRDTEIVLTTTTSTGYAEARKLYADTVRAVGIFPIDFVLFSALAWRRLKADAVVLTESELWPEHLHQARKRGASAFLINARMSDKSFNRYQSTGSLARLLFSQLDHIYAASELDRERLLKLGGESVRVTCTGSIKCDVPLPPALDSEKRAALRDSLGFGASGGKTPFVLLGASTWPGEEAVLIDIQGRLIAEGADCRLLLVPRHAERRSEVVRLLEGLPLAWHQRSTGASPSGDVRIYLADTTGELTHLSQAADLAFIGKSLPPNEGGQTPIEAAGLGIPILCGPQMSNFKAVVRALVHTGAAKQIPDAGALHTTVRELWRDFAARELMGRQGRVWHRRNRGSSARIAEAILTDLRHSDSSHESNHGL